MTKKDVKDVFDDIILMDGMTELSARKISCNYCGTLHFKSDVKLQISAYYCPSCINMGRVRSDEKLYHLSQRDFKSSDAMNWSGQLTEYQAEISSHLIEAVGQKSQILVHAVTGAGKTEMIYEAINQILKLGGAAAIARPRIDVCIELHKRLSKDSACQLHYCMEKAIPTFERLL